MSLDTHYDHENIFAKIITGDIPCTKVFENDDILSFMDLFPQSRGHTLVISKKATAVNLFDIAPTHLHPLIDGVQKIGGAISKGLKPDGIRLMQFNGAQAGQTVFHLHFHLIPVYTNSDIEPHTHSNQADIKELETIAQQIQSAL